MRNIVKQFYWNHINDRRVGIQHVPVFRRYSAQIQLVPLKMMIMIRIRVGQIHRHNGQQNNKITVHTAPSLSEECSTHIYRRPRRKE